MSPPARFAEDFGGIKGRERSSPVHEWRTLARIIGTVQLSPDGGGGDGGAGDGDGGAGVGQGSPDAAVPAPAVTSPVSAAESSAEPDVISGAGGVPPPCDPQPMTRANFLSQAGARQTDPGLTVMSGQVVVPVVQISPAVNGRVQQTSAALPPISSVYTRGTFVEGTGHFIAQGTSGCPTGTYPMQWNIYGSGDAAVKAGEVEHCADFRVAFDLSLNRFAQAVNVAAQAGRRFPNQRSAEQFFQRRVGVAPAAWLPHFECLANKTKLRDTSGSHTPAGVGRGTREPQPPCDRAVLRFFLDQGHLPRIGRTSSASLITPAGCPVS